MREVLRSEIVALRNFFEVLDHTLVQGASTFLPKVSDFIIIIITIIHTSDVSKS